jgi:hypothetical protein
MRSFDLNYYSGGMKNESIYQGVENVVIGGYNWDLNQNVQCEQRVIHDGHEEGGADDEDTKRA